MTHAAHVAGKARILVRIRGTTSSKKSARLTSQKLSLNLALFWNVMVLSPRASSWVSVVPRDAKAHPPWENKTCRVKGIVRARAAHVRVDCGGASKEPQRSHGRTTIGVETTVQARAVQAVPIRCTGVPESSHPTVGLQQKIPELLT